VCLGGVLCFFLASSAWADLIANYGSTGTGTWQAFPTTLTEGANPVVYWDNQSVDGPQSNVGYFITGQSPFSNSPNLTSPQWLGTGTGAPLSLIFTRT
ncbi:hypothetical protein, partial [Enterococcus faecium]